MTKFTNLPLRSAKGAALAVIETPRGSSVKYVFSPVLQAFAVSKFLKLAKKRFEIAIRRPRKQSRQPIVQRLFEAGVPGSVYWTYDSAFGVMEHADGATSWAEAEAWLAEHAPPECYRERWTWIGRR